MKRVPLYGLLALVLVVLPFLGGCGSAKSSAPAKSSTPAAPSTKTLNVGFVGSLGGSGGVDDEHCLQVMAAMDNAKGGITIGGTKYKVNLICFDDNNSQATGTSDINRLIFQDHVKIIISDDGAFLGSYVAITDPNKVLLFGGSPSMVNLQPKWHYSFNPNGEDTLLPMLVAWFAQKYPSIVKNFALALPDNQMGHFVSMLIGQPAEVMGAHMTDLYYPPNQTDLSSLGTKVKVLNPGVFSASGSGSDVQDGLAMTAAWQAGYRGQYFIATTSAYGDLAKVMPSAALNGLICGAVPVEFDPAPTPAAKAFKAAYIAKFGKWNDPNTQGTTYYACMKAALQAAGTTDPAKVAAVVAHGLKYTAPIGQFEMIPPSANLHNSRTVDSIGSIYMKQIKNGKPVLIGQLSLQQSLNLWHTLQAKEAKMKPPASKH